MKYLAGPEIGGVSMMSRIRTQKLPNCKRCQTYCTDGARILKKQNRVQMSQVLLRGSRSSHQVVLLFKDSSEAAGSRRCQAERGLPSIAFRWSEARPR
jgi:hypothetical protein